jgi:hypothetical protein
MSNMKDTLFVSGQQLLVELEQINGRKGAGVFLLTMHLEIDGRQDLSGAALYFRWSCLQPYLREAECSTLGKYIFPRARRFSGRIAPVISLHAAPNSAYRWVWSRSMLSRKRGVAKVLN